MSRNIITWNVRGAGRNVDNKLRRLSECIEHYNPIIILLQDAGCEDDNVYIKTLLDNSYEVYDVVAGNTERYRLITAVKVPDISVMTNHGRIEYDSTYRNDPGARRPLLLDCLYNQVRFHLYNVYNITNQQKSKQEIIDLYTYVQHDGAANRIVAGDFNLTSTLLSLNIQGYETKRNNLDYVTSTFTLQNSHHILSPSDHEILICEVDFR